jgi:hypothetical protein
MNDNLKMGQSAVAAVVRPSSKPLSDELSPKGRFKVEHWRGGVKIAEYDFPNYITNEGRSLLLNLFFHTGTGTQITAWFMGLVDNASFSTFNQTDSYAQVNGTNGWKENTAYTDAGNGGSSTTRPAWGPGAASVASNVAQVTNASTVVFNVTATGNIQGLFIVGGNSNSQLKSDATTGATLWSAAAFTTAPVAVQNGDQLKVTYSVTA